jgi:hypothetical protein
MRSKRDLWHGIISQPKKLAFEVFVSFSLAFTIVRAITHFFPLVKFDGAIPLSIILLLNADCDVNKVWKASITALTVATCSTVIEDLLGNAL